MTYVAGEGDSFDEEVQCFVRLGDGKGETAFVVDACGYLSSAHFLFPASLYHILSNLGGFGMRYVPEAPKLFVMTFAKQ